MNRFIKLSIIILALGTVCMTAQAADRSVKQKEWREKNPYIFSVNFGIGGQPQYAVSYYDIGATNYNSRIWSYLYSDYRGAIMTTGTFGGEFNWNISRWFNASGYLGLCPIWNDIYDGITDTKKGRHTGVAIFVMPKAKVMWCNSPVVRVYTSLSLGFSLLPGFKYADPVIQPAYQFNLAGVEVGRKWYGFCELGAGSAFIGGQIGFGFKF